MPIFVRDLATLNSIKEGDILMYKRYHEDEVGNILLQIQQIEQLHQHILKIKGKILQSCVGDCKEGMNWEEVFYFDPKGKLHSDHILYKDKNGKLRPTWIFIQ